MKNYKHMIVYSFDQRPKYVSCNWVNNGQFIQGGFLAYTSMESFSLFITAKYKEEHDSMKVCTKHAAVDNIFSNTFSLFQLSTFTNNTLRSLLNEQLA